MHFQEVKWRITPLRCHMKAAVICERERNARRVDARWAVTVHEMVEVVYWLLVILKNSAVYEFVIDTLT